MIEVRIYHHVYTSLGGYKTVHASDGLEQDVVRHLEVFCNRVYPRVKERTLSFLLRPTPSHICVSRVFAGGADHAGRPRSCVHSILVEAGSISNIPFFNPLTIPDSLFLTEAPDAARVPGLRARLPLRYAAAETTSDDVKAILSSGEMLTEPTQSLFLSIFSGNNTVLAINSHDYRRAITKMATLLPSALRLNLAMADGCYFEFPRGTPAVYCLPRAEALQLAEKGFIIIDPASNSTRNLPVPNRFCQFVFQSIGQDADRVVKLLRVMERYPVQGMLTSDMYHYLIKSYEATSNCFTEEGELAIAADPRRCLDNALLFFRGGYSSIVVAILQQALEILEKKGELPPSSSVLKKVEESLSDPRIPGIQKEESITRLSAFLAKQL